MKISIETKLNFNDPQDRKTLIQAMHVYSNAVKYGLKAMRPKSDDESAVYSVLTDKFPNLPARTVSLAVHEDIKPIINSFTGLESKDYPLSMRFDGGNSEFYVEDDVVKLKIAIDRPEKGKLTYIVASLMAKKNLKYKYYKYLFLSKKGMKLPFRLMMRNGQIYAKVTVDRQTLLAESNKPTVYVGIDLRAHWLGRGNGNPMAVAFLNEDGSFAMQPRLFHEWADIPKIIRAKQANKQPFKKPVENQIGIIIKQLIELTRDYNPIFRVEDLTRLNQIEGPYSKFFYRKFRHMLETKSLNIQVINPAYTSTTCSRCGERGKTEKRTFYCAKCYPKGWNKFINAAVNIAKSSFSISKT